MPDLNEGAFQDVGSVRVPLRLLDDTRDAGARTAHALNDVKLSRGKQEKSNFLTPMKNSKL
jgi:hypothetical protein